jgi:hypothetical protein
LAVFLADPDQPSILMPGRIRHRLARNFAHLMTITVK